MTEDPRLRLLFVEDLPTDVELAEREFKANGFVFDSLRVDTKEDYLEALVSFHPDVVISDYSMPRFDGMTALLLAKEFDPFIPFIVLTGSMNEDTAVTCMKAGASDYVIKEHMTRLTFAVREAIERKRILEKAAVQEALLRESEERYRSIFSNSHAVMLIIDPANNVIMDANQAASEFYGWSRATLIGKGMEDINTLGADMIREQVRKVLLLEKKYFLNKHRKAGGAIVDVEIHAGPLTIGAKTYLISIIHDISGRIAAQAERDALSLKLSHYLSTSPTITYSLRVDSGVARWEWISENVIGILGYSLVEVLAANWWFKNVFAADRATALKGIAELNRKESFSQEYRFSKKDRTVVWLRDDMRLVKNGGAAMEIVGTLTDITERKLAEAEVRLKSAALEVADNAVVITDRDGTIEWVNTAHEKLTGFSKSDSIGRNPRALTKSGKVAPATYRELWDTIVAGRVWRGELLNKKKSGEMYHEEITITPVMDESRRIVHFIAIKSDITERTISKERLEASLREKEVLLREIHHRVKNNMQVISSLLNLSADEIEDPKIKRTIMEINRRIDAMAIVHELFYEAGNLEQIDFALYLRRMTAELLEECQAPGEKPSVSYEMEETKLSLEKAIPAGLIVSEFVSNAINFAFAGRPGLLKISLRRRDGGIIEIEVRDNGVGLPEGFDPKTARTLGMQMIGILAEQLRGTTSYLVDGGTVASLEFSCVTLL